MANNNWTSEQKQAIEKRDSNILVSASAGSGKTAVLVERIIQKVLNEYLDIDKILVVTFTNAAAQELKEKILSAIYEALEKEKDIKKINHLKNQLVYINRASITTIDAFCYKLVRENFNLLDLDPNIRICEESQAILLKSKVLEELLEKKYEEYSNEKDVFGLYNILELFNGKDEDFIESILEIYNYIQAFPYPFKWLEEQIAKYNIQDNVDLYDTDFGRDIYLDIIDEIKLCILKYDDYLDKINGIDEFAKCAEILNNDLFELKKCINIQENSWDVLYDNLNNVEFKKFMIGKVSNEELKGEIAEFRKKEVVEQIKSLKKKIYAKSADIIQDNKEAYKYISYLYEFLKTFDSMLKDEKKKASIAEFNDIMHYALELLVDEEDNLTPIANIFKEKYEEVYTDEYQDTSYVQERILQAVSRDANRFMVGDIKQSIYRFRQARPDIFNDKYNEYKKIEEQADKNCKIILSKNFRSRKEVIDSINYIFEKIMSMKNGECNYSLDEALKCGNESYSNVEDCSYKTQINIINLKEEEKDYFTDEEDPENLSEDLKNIQVEAKCIAYKIKEIIKTVKVKDKANTVRNATYKDIVILLKSVKDKANVIEQALKENGIPVFCDVSSSIFEGDEVKLILSFLRVLDNPYQDIYMTSIMYSIIGNFNLDEITKIRLYDNSSYIYDTLNAILKDDDFKKREEKIYAKVSRFVDIILKYTKCSKILSIADLLIRIYKDTNIYYQFNLEDDAESKKANLDYLVELASSFYMNISNTLSSYIRYIDNLKDKQDKSSSAKIIGENENVVRIMTIHKSKGLEFPIVILGDCAKGYNYTDIRKNKVVFHYKYGIGIDIVNQDLQVTYPSLIKQSIKSVIEKETKSEEMRLLYVALTRAKEKLYIFATTKDYQKEYDMQNTTMKDGKFNESLIAKNSSYYKNLLPVIKYYNEFENENKCLEIVTTDINSKATDEELREMFNQEEENSTPLSIKDKINHIKNSKNVEENRDLIDKLEENMEKEYTYIEDATLPARISVSNLKKNKIEEEGLINSVSKIKDEIEEEEIKSKYKIPDMLNEENTHYTAVRKGILIHFILQNLDFSMLNTKQEVQDYIQKLVVEGTISEQDRKYISATKIYNFLNSDIGKLLKKSKKAYREYEFILKSERISKSTIQGVIDLFYITDDDKVILVDFKTDKLDNDLDFIKKYKIQLDIYKEAIETLTNYNVDKVYIYSFNLNKPIEIVEE